MMNLTGILLLAAVLQVSAHSAAQTVTYSASKTPLTSVFTALKQQTGYVFFYDSQDLRDATPVTVDLHDTPLPQALETILSGQPLGFVIKGNTIVITRKEKIAEPKAVIPPPADIHGRITDSLGNPLPGASVTVKGTNKGTTTNANGEFTLTGVPSDATLIISNVGYQRQELPLRGRTTLLLQLRVAPASMQDFVVNKGYYSVKQAENTGNVSVVTAKVIGEQPVSDPILTLEGRVPGMQITQTSGMPGANSTIRIRGRNSITNGTDPLYIVDGVPYTATSFTGFVSSAAGTPSRTPNPNGGGGLSPFNSLNPADIESIEVLKDADATAIYGSRGANGVVLITTKKGKAGRTRVDVNLNSGMGDVVHFLPLLNTQQYLAMRHEAFKNDNIPFPSITTSPTDRNYEVNGTWDTTRYTNWEKTLIGNKSHFTTANVSVSGGNTNTQSLLSGAYSRNTTVFPGDFNDQKASMRVNLNHISTNLKFHSQFDAQYVHDENLLPRTDFTQFITLAPDAPALYTPSGGINFQNGTFNNPIASAMLTSASVNNNLVSSLNLDYELLSGLKIQSRFGYTRNDNQTLNIAPASANYGPPNPNRRTNLSGTNNVTTWIIEPQLDYQRMISKGKLDVLIGSTIQRSQTNAQGFYGTGFSDDALISNIANASTVFALGAANTDYRYNAVYARINYSWEDKYIINATGRRDGSSRFGPGNQFGNFGAVGAAWIFTKERGIAGALPFLSLGKLRASYGTTGSDQITDYQYLSTYTISGNYQNTATMIPMRIANPYYAWERDDKLEVGIELGFLQNRIQLETVYFRNRTGNQLVGQPLPNQDGFDVVQANLPAVVQNTGFEAELNTFNIKGGHFKWNTSFNISVPRNKLVAYPGLASSAYRNTFAVGKSLYVRKLYTYTGVDPNTGIYTFQNLNGNGQLGIQDRQFNAAIEQQYYGGLQNSFSYKNCQLDIFFQFVKQTGSNLQFAISPPGTNNTNQPTYVLSRWQNPGDQSNVEKFTTTGGPVQTAFLNALSSNYFILDASYIRLKNIAISYSLPQAWQRTLTLQSARIYLQGQNLLTFTSYKGFDPETQGLSLPPLRIIALGIQASF